MTTTAGTTRPAPGEPVSVSRLLERLQEDAAGVPEVVVLGGGCAGLALATAFAERGGTVAVVDALTAAGDGRTWCYWDTGEALLPEAVSMSWQQWEVRTPDRTVVRRDAAHPYRMVRARDYRAAARLRITSTGRGQVIDGVRVRSDAWADSPEPARRRPWLVDARGQRAVQPRAAGRTSLHQRFVGCWIRTTRPVFDTSTVTLMDFDPGSGHEVRFFYVLPVAQDLALVECTVFSRSAHGAEPFREHIRSYLRRRWDLAPHDWAVEGEEAGSIPMTDHPAPRDTDGRLAFGLRAGVARASTGYAFTRIQIAARAAAIAFALGRAPRLYRDRWRTRALDAIFLRFLRDQPGAAPAVFLRMFDRLPGPLTVRFLTERSSPLDEIRLILALPKAPFLLAAATTFRERVGALRR